MKLTHPKSGAEIDVHKDHADTYRTQGWTDVVKRESVKPAAKRRNADG